MKKITLQVLIRLLKFQLAWLDVVFTLTKRNWFLDRKIRTGIVIISLLNAVALYGQSTRTVPARKSGSGKTDTCRIQVQALPLTGEPDPAVFCYVTEEVPIFPYGDVKAYLNKNIRYPQQAIDKGIHGRVIVQMVIDTLGNVTNVQVVRGISPELDEEAVRVVKSMPQWKPGKRHNKTAPIKYTLPVDFKLPERTTTD
jgi:TonB family protein